MIPFVISRPLLAASNESYPFRRTEYSFQFLHSFIFDHNTQSLILRLRVSELFPRPAQHTD